MLTENAELVSENDKLKFNSSCFRLLLILEAVPALDSRPLLTPRGDGVSSKDSSGAYILLEENEPSTFNTDDLRLLRSNATELLNETSPLLFKNKDLRTWTDKSCDFFADGAGDFLVKKLGLVVLSHSYMLLRFLTGKVVAQERLVSKSCLVFATVKLRLVEALLEGTGIRDDMFVLKLGITDRRITDFNVWSKPATADVVLT
jgi:hypothetical protein